MTVSSSISSLPLRFLPLVVTAALAGPSCECRQSERVTNGAHDAKPTNRPAVAPAPRHDRAWTPAERDAIAKLTAVVTEYYPAWAPERESADDYFARFEDAPETLRLQALIRRRVDRDRNRWRACLADVRAALGTGDGREISVRNGTPPMFYIPSFQIVIGTGTAHEGATLVFRLSMLAPVYDYYERTYDARGEHLRLVPGETTAPLARRVGDVIAKHFPSHRELPAEIGAVRVPGVITLNPDGELVEHTLAELLFEDTRRW